jgi:hypothetical protein
MPVGWMYMNEVANYKGVTTGTGLNLFLRCVIGLTTGPMYKSETIGPSGSFAIFGCINFTSMILIYVFMKETKGLTEVQISKLYLHDETGNSVLAFRSKKALE